MSKVKTRQDILDALIKYLPKIATSIGKTVENLQLVIKTDGSSINTDNVDATASILEEFGSILPALQILLDEIPQDVLVRDENADITILYLKAFTEIHSGIEEMLSWVVNEDRQSDQLESSINHLYNGGQAVFKLVDLILSE